MTSDALDDLDRARALIELAKMACRSADDDLNAIATGLCAAGDHLDRARGRLQVSGWGIVGRENLRR